MEALTKVQIINETADFYSTNPSYRGINPSTDNCEYFTKRHDVAAMCAVGRCLNEEGVKRYTDFSGPVNAPSAPVLEIHLKPEYMGHDLQFWRELQHFHDSSVFWNYEGMTEKGTAYKAKLLTSYAE